MDDPPQNFLCPISFALMKNPVSTADGQIYDEDCIVMWFSNNKNTSPTTNLTLQTKVLTPMPELKERINLWKSEHPDHPEVKRAQSTAVFQSLSEDVNTALEGIRHFRRKLSGITTIIFIYVSYCNI